MRLLASGAASEPSGKPCASHWGGMLIVTDRGAVIKSIRSQKTERKKEASFPLEILTLRCHYTLCVHISR